MDFLGSNLNLNQSELKESLLESRTSPPSNPVESQQYYDPITKIPYIFRSGQWVPTLGSSSSGSGNIDGGNSNSVYGGISGIDAGNATSF